MPDGRAITSERLAVLIVDALVDAGLVPRAGGSMRADSGRAG
jgi:hypothetical protein